MHHKNRSLATMMALVVGTVACSQSEQKPKTVVTAPYPQSEQKPKTVDTVTYPQSEQKPRTVDTVTYPQSEQKPGTEDRPMDAYALLCQQVSSYNLEGKTSADLSNDKLEALLDLSLDAISEGQASFGKQVFPGYAFSPEGAFVLNVLDRILQTKEDRFNFEAYVDNTLWDQKTLNDYVDTCVRFARHPYAQHLETSIQERFLDYAREHGGNYQGIISRLTDLKNERSKQ